MNIVIIGNGITGITSARNIRKLRSDAQITVISAESDHFFSRTALMYIYMGQMKFEHTKPYEDWFWEKNKIKLVKGYVKDVDPELKTLTLQDGRTIPYGILIIASGSKSNKFKWPGQNMKGVQSLYSIQDLEAIEMDTQNISAAVIVGGGLIGIEMAEMLLSRKIPVTLLVRENAYWGNILPPEEAGLIGRHIREHGIDLRLNTELKEVLPDEQGRARAIVTNSGENIKCQFVGLTTGVSPNIKFLENSGIETEQGILVNEYFETNIPCIYAAGDCAQFRQPKPDHPDIEQLWYTGKMQAETLAKTICNHKTAYQRGIWFNSAKFLDIEYQSYGLMLPILNEVQDSFYWEHHNGKIAFRATYNKTDRTLIGFNFLGIRFRQIIADHWIRNQKTVDYAIQNLAKGWFDPEFTEPHYRDIALAFSTVMSPKL